MNYNLQRFKEKYYMTKDRATIFGYAAIGILAPVAGIRYTIFRDWNSNITEHAAAWLLSAAGCIPISPITGGIGAGIGKITVNEWQKRRELLSKRNDEDSLENKIEVEQ